MDWLSFPPIFFLLLSVLIYPLFMVVKGSPGLLVMLLAVIALGSFFLLPGGRALFTAAQQLPSMVQRAECLGQAVKNGAPISSTAAAKSSKCSFAGRSLPPSSDPELARQLMNNARASLPG